MDEIRTGGADLQTPSNNGRRSLFVVTIFVGSFLLFMVQPMVARMVLPRLGGAPNVWNSAMLAYQALLLAGYGYAHIIARLRIARQVAIHIAVLLAAACTLPISLPDIPLPSAGSEVVWVPWLLGLTIGPVFLVVAAQAPLMQRWFAEHPEAGNPYPLYAASNLGSFAGLIAYPLVMEPTLTLRAQSMFWAAGYGLLVVLVLFAALARRSAAPPAERAEISPQGAVPTVRDYALWLALAAVPSGLMLSTTTHLTTDIFALPLLWVIPLGLYLLSFSIAFAGARSLANTLSSSAPVVLGACAALSLLGSVQQGVALAADLLLLLVVSVALHSRLYLSRPDPSRLTTFYLAMSAGGVIGGLFTALVAPLVFDWTWEHPLLIVMAGSLLPFSHWSRLLAAHARLFARTRVALALVILAALAVRAGWFGDWRLDRLGLDLLLVVPAAAATILMARTRAIYVGACAVLIGGLCLNQIELTLQGVRSRSYFGIYTVRDISADRRELIHGTTLHGVQYLAPSKSILPTTYYGNQAGVGRALLAANSLFGPKARVGVVGLGVGTLACYGRPGQTWSFFEIDPVVYDYSRRHVFTFLAQCAPQARVVIGDARINLAKEPAAAFDLLVVDAFSSDAIPLHLLTREAFQAYFRALSRDGLLVIHISNKFVDLEPVLAAFAQQAQVAAVVRHDRPKDASVTDSDWVIISRSPQKLAELTHADPQNWQGLQATSSSVWTDNHASILPHFKWTKLF